MNRSKTLIAFVGVSAFVAFGLVRAAKADHAVELGGKDGGHAIELGGKDGGHAIELGGKDGGHAIELGGKDGGHAEAL